MLGSANAGVFGFDRRAVGLREQRTESALLGRELGLYLLVDGLTRKRAPPGGFGEPGGKRSRAIELRRGELSQNLQDEIRFRAFIEGIEEGVPQSAAPAASRGTGSLALPRGLAAWVWIRRPIKYRICICASRIARCVFGVEYSGSGCHSAT